jgi:hypothetical protein
VITEKERLSSQARLSPAFGEYGSSGDSSFELIAGVTISSSGKFPEMPCYIRPPFGRNEHFVGRQKILGEMDKELLPSKRIAPNNANNVNDIISFALCGLGGLGKTQIAAEFALSHEEEFDAIFWIDADGVQKLDEGFSRIAEELGLVKPGESDSGDKDRTANRNLALGWLEKPETLTSPKIGGETEPSPTKTKWLLIFDNADDLEILWDYWPQTGNGAILLTSRDPMAKTRPLLGKSGKGLDVTPFTTDESKELLWKLVGESCKVENEQKQEILLERLSGLPLAVRQTAATVRQKRITLNEFIQVYSTELFVSELNEVESMPQQDRYKYTLATVWSFNEPNPGAEALATVLSFMDPTRVYEHILKTNDAEAARLIDYPVGNDYLKARARLDSTSLVSRNLEEGYLSLHRLVQEVSQLQRKKEYLEKTFEFVVDLLFDAWPKKADRFSLVRGTWEPSEKVIHHIRSALTEYQKHPERSISKQKQLKFCLLVQQGAMCVYHPFTSYELEY